MSLDFVTNQEIIQAARKNLTQDIWDYLSGGAESETTLRRNRLAFDYLALRPRVCIDVSRWTGAIYGCPAGPGGFRNRASRATHA